MAIVLAATVGFVWLTERATHKRRIDRALFAAVEAGNTAEVRELLREGANPNVRETPVPAPRGLFRQVKQLLRPRDSQESGRSALISAAWWGRTEIVDLLLKAHVDVNVRDDLSGTALTFAARSGHDQIVIRLLKAGANPNIAETNGTTPLWGAIWRCNGSTVRALLESGAAFDPQSRDGRNLIGMALGAEDSNVLAALLDRGVPVEGKLFGDDRTLLQHASSEGNVKSVRLLLDRGANINATDHEGKTALAWAKMQRQQLISKLTRHGTLGAGEMTEATSGYDRTIRLLESRGARWARP